MDAIGIAVRIACPSCARAGVATWVQTDAHSSRKVDELSAGFLSIDAGANDGPRIVCQKCRICVDECPAA